VRANIRAEFFNKVKGAIFGQAIGDALGHPIEFQKTHEIVDLEEGMFTDDTQMFAAIGEAMLLAPPHKDIEKFMDVMAQKFIEWRNAPLGGTHRAPGNTCMEATRKLGTGRHWRQTGATNIGKGNGSAMRAGIIGARYWKNPPYAFSLGCLTSIPTHNNLESILASGMVAYLVAASIVGIPWADAVARGLELCSMFMSTVPGYPTNSVPLNDERDGQSPWKAIMQFSNGYIYGTGDVDPEEFLKTNGNDFTAVPATAEAIYFNTRHSTEHLDSGFDAMLLECANWSDDSDTITAITGTIAGARFGFDSINDSWSDDDVEARGWAARVELAEYFHDLTNRIFEASMDETPEDKAERTVVATVEQTLDVDEFGGSDEEFAGINADYVARAIDSGALETVEAIDEDDFEVEF
jgi:ADP-ribosyl-[dinitrogen reductase] hydrolase